MNFAPLRLLLFRRCSSSRHPTRLLSTATSAEPPPHTSAATWLFFGTPIAITFSLGVWQVKRLARKKDLMHDRDARLSATPLTARELQTTDDIDYRRVELHGRFLHDKEMLVGPRGAPSSLPPAVLQWGGSSGLHVVTPCRLSDTGAIVLVHRGWIPHRLMASEKRLHAAVCPTAFLQDGAIVASPSMADDGSSESDGDVHFTGVVRTCEERNRFVPANVPERGEWFYIDVDAMLRKADVDGNKGFAHGFVEMCEPIPANGWPFPRPVEQFAEFRTPPSTHVTYAITWFSLSGALALLTRFRLRRQVRTRS